jgi:ATP-dependent DNA helicase Q1
MREPDALVDKDVTLDAWRVLRVAAHVEREGGRVTLPALAELVRGVGKGVFAVTGGKRKRNVGEERVDLEVVCGGKIGLGKDVSTRVECLGATCGD